MISRFSIYPLFDVKLGAGRPSAAQSERRTSFHSFREVPVKDLVALSGDLGSNRSACLMINCYHSHQTHLPG